MAVFNNSSHLIEEKEENRPLRVVPVNSIPAQNTISLFSFDRFTSILNTGYNPFSFTSSLISG